MPCDTIFIIACVFVWYIIIVNTVDCLRTDKTMPRKKYWRISKARQTVEDKKMLSSEVGVLKLSDGGLSQPKLPSVSLEMGVMKISDGGNAQPKKPSVSFEMGVMKISDGGNAQPKKPSVSVEMGVMNLSDGGNAQPTKPSVSEIADIVIDTLPETLKIPDTLNEPLNVSLNEHMPHTLTELMPHTLTELMPNAVAKTNTEIHLVPDTLINTMPETDVTHNDSHSFAHNDTRCCSRNDNHSIPHSDFHSTPLAYNKSFAVQFMESSGNDCLKTQIDFDKAFAEAFPNIVVKRQKCSNEELTENKEVAYIELIESNATSFCDSHFEIIDTDDQVATQPSRLLWNANQIIFGSFHQNDERFIDQSRGFQCTCNALCMLVHDDIQNSSVLDQILYNGDELYNRTVNNLKAEGKFVNSLLSLEEIPDTLDFKTGQYFVEKQQIACGYLVNTLEDEALPTLHCALETAFLKSASVLLIIGAICSAISKRNNLYVFFDSHSHGENGLSSSDGTSILMLFSCLEDLVAYLYAFYESMCIDLTMQFDLMPISIRKKEHSGSQEKQPESLLEAYFHDQTLRQKQKAIITKSTKKSEPGIDVKKKKNRKEYYKIYRQNVRQQNSLFKAKELDAQRKRMHKIRLDRDYKAKELVAQRKSKQNARQDKDYKAKELVAQRKHMHKARQDRDYKAKELGAQRKHMHKARQDRDYNAKESVAQRKSKQNARQDKDYKAKELVAQRKHMHKARRDRDYKAKELVAQRKSKQNARKNPFVLECERVKKQEKRRMKRKLDKENECINLETTCKKRKKKLDDHEKTSYQSHYKDIKECIKQFHSSIAVGPLFVCTCCHQTWFRKGVCMLKNINLPTSSSLYCTKFTSVNDEEWICHTCMGAIRDGKVPKLSAANGMKWPEKPPELDLHQLEERLISLRIPFMQIRELPRGGQYSLKGNVINVPVDIQPTVSCLPRPMDENFTIAVQLKKKLSYKKVDFKENVRPLRVLTALHWLVNKSELYKRSGVEIDVNWFKEVTESSEETVREFLEVSSKQNREKHKQNRNEEDMNVSSFSKDSMTADDYDSDHYSEIDTNEQVGNVDTLVDDQNLENKYDKVITFAPGEGQHPLSLYHDADAEYLCFPTIFCGQRRPSKEERTVTVHYSDIVKWELRSVDRRAAQSVPNIFFKHKKLQMKQISDKVNLAVRRCKGNEKKITAAEARNSEYLDKLVNLDEGYYIFRQLRNSPAYLQSRKKDIFAMIRQLSLPTWFMSLSAADTRWTDLLKMLAKLNNGISYTDKDIEELTWQEKTKLVQKDPVTCSRYFDHRVQEFLNIILKSNCEPIGKLRDFFYRVEFQQRGSPHIHMLVWIDNALSLEKNSEEEIVQFVDKYLTCSLNDEQTAHLVELQTHKHSRTCRKKGKAICRFGFPLPPLPQTRLLYPLEEDVDQFKKKYSELQRAMNENKDNDVSFAEFLETVAKMTFEDYIKCIRSSLNAPKVFLKRAPNEMRVNLFNGKILLAWKANLDIQIVLEPYGCASYVVGYISKSQRGMSALLEAAAKEARKGNSDIKKQVRHIGNVFSNCVEVGAQEAVYLALQIPLTKGTREVVYINTCASRERVFLLKPKSVLDELPAESTNIESDNIVQRYSKRPKQLQRFCLADYVSQVDIIYPKGNKLPDKVEYRNDDSISDENSSDENENSEDEETVENGKIVSDLIHIAKNGTKYKYRKVPKVIRYVRYNQTKDPENYYREQLMLFMPWRNEQKDLLGSFETYRAHYNTMKESLEIKRNQYEHHSEELELARQMMEAEEAEYDGLAPNAEQENREAEEEGVKESENFVYFNPDRVVEHRHYDIGIELQSTCSVPRVETSSFMLPDEEYLRLLRSLNLRQREFFNHIIHWIKCRDEPIHAFLSGGAGVGKSVVIRALYQSLYRMLNLREGENPDDIRVLLCAYMGTAAFNIGGNTICSAFHKKMYQTDQRMSADQLNTFRIKYKHLKVVIIDEISMVGKKTFDFIDTRLQQLTGIRAPFGGLSVIAVGDFYQLKPVGDRLVFLDLDEDAKALAPNSWKDHFKIYELVDIMRQKDDLKFAQLLNRLRLNELTEEDKDNLRKRVVDRNSGEYPRDAVHLFAEKEGMYKHNKNVMNDIDGEEVDIPCHDTVASANISPKKARELISQLPDDPEKTANMEKVLTVKVGMKYNISVNVNVEDGLANGTTGKVKFIEYKIEGNNRPSIIWMKFDDPRIGKATREKYFQRGFYHSNIQRDWTPIFEVERTFLYKHKMYQRIQFPLRPAAAKTVHKGQGITEDEIVVDLTQYKGVRKVPHIHYVAFSRVRKLENLFILNLNEAAIGLDEQVHVEMQRLRMQESLELSYTPLYKIDPSKIKLAFNNARSLHKHFEDVQFEPNVLSADVIGFAESRLCSRDEDVNFALNRFRLVRLDETARETRPHHGLALYVKEHFAIQEVVKHHSQFCEFISAKLHSKRKGQLQVVVFYKYPKCSQTDLKKDIINALKPLVGPDGKFVIMGDFNVPVNDAVSPFICFMETLFGCSQHIRQPTTDHGSLLDLVFANCDTFCDVIEAYWTDHKLIYCALDT